MPRYSLKSALVGLTVAAIGFGMLGIAFQRGAPGVVREVSFGHAMTVAIGGAFVGLGLSFPVRWPVYRVMIAPMVGMFAAQAWESGNWVGLIVYVGLLGAWGVGSEVGRRMMTRREREEEV